MNCLEERIQQDGWIKTDKILKVDSFLNHQVDLQLLDEMAELFYERFKDVQITKVLTIEASGIAIAAAIARRFKVPMVFAKKGKTSNLGENLYQSKIYSFTHQKEYTLVMSRDYLSDADTVLVVDDFLASGSALNGLLEIVEMSKAKLGGICIAIEKGFQKGGDQLREKGLPLYSLAIIDSMDPKTKQLYFRQS